MQGGRQFKEHKSSRRVILFIEPAGEAYGSEQSMLRLLKAMRNFRAEVVCSPMGSLRNKLQALGVKVHVLEFGKFSFRQSPQWHFWLLVGFLRIIRRAQPQAVVLNLDGNTPAAMLAAALAAVPVVRFSRFEFSPPRRWIDRFCWRNPAAVICPSQLVQRQFQTWAPRSLHQRIHHWYDPVPMHLVSDEQTLTTRVKLGLNSSRVIGYVGRLHRDKGLETALRALAIARRRVPHLCLLVAGKHDGSPAGTLYEQHLRTLACDLGIDESVRFLGYRDDVDVLMSLFDVCVLPSQSESFGMVLAEAWAMQVPTAASDVGGCREITLASGGGRLSSAGDAVTLAENVLAFLNHPALAERCGESGHAWVQAHCDPDQYARRFEELIGSLQRRGRHNSR